MNELLLLLGLTALADSEDQAAIASGIKEKVQGLLDSKKKSEDFLALHDADDFTAITQKINDGKKEVTDFLALHDAESLSKFSDKLKRKDAEAAVAAKMTGEHPKINESMKDAAIALALSDMDQFEKIYGENAPDAAPGNAGLGGEELGKTESASQKTEKSRTVALSDAVDRGDLEGTIANAPVSEV